MIIEQVDIALKLEGVEQARAALDALTVAAERAKRAIADLQGQPHGGIDIQIVGCVAHVEIKPAS